MIIADASVWRAALDPHSMDVGAQVADLWSNRGITAPVPVFAELLAECDSASEVEQLRSWATTVPVVPISSNAWMAAGDLAAKLRQGGDLLNLIDVFAILMAVREDLPLWSLNRAVLSAIKSLPVKAWSPGSRKR